MTLPSHSPHPPQGVLVSRNRRWLFIGAGVVILVLVVWAVARRGGSAAATERPESAVAGSAAKGEQQERIDSVVTLSTASLRLVPIEIVSVGSLSGSALTANGTITFDANHASVVAPRAEGRVVTVRADLGQPVQAGTVLAVLESSEVGETRGAVERAEANLEVAKQTYEREKSLYEQQVTSQKSMLEAQAAYKSATADLNAARAKLQALGGAGTAAASIGGSYSLVSPVPGTIVERNVMPGQIAGPTTNLFTVADVRRVWINVDVYESDARLVRPGAPVAVMTRALPGETFRGRVTYAGGVVDTATRTLKVRVEVDNAAQRLRPGMYAQVHIDIPRGAAPVAETGASAMIPEGAVQDLNGKTVVFVPGGQPGRFIARPIAVGPRVGGGFISILSGLAPGDRFVAKGAFQLKSELLKASFGEKE